MDFRVEVQNHVLHPLDERGRKEGGYFPGKLRSLPYFMYLFILGDFSS